MQYNASAWQEPEEESAAPTAPAGLQISQEAFRGEIQSQAALAPVPAPAAVPALDGPVAAAPAVLEVAFPEISGSGSSGSSCEAPGGLDGAFDFVHAVVDWEGTPDPVLADMMRLLKTPMFAKSVKPIRKTDLAAYHARGKQEEDEVDKAIEGMIKADQGWGEMYSSFTEQMCPSLPCCPSAWETAVVSQGVRKEIDELVRHGSLFPTHPFTITGCDRGDTTTTVEDVEGLEKDLTVKAQWPHLSQEQKNCCSQPMPVGRVSGDKRQLIPEQYGIYKTTAQQFGEIGGAGLHLYFDTLLTFARMFLFCAIAVIPNLVMNLGGNWDSDTLSSIFDAANVTNATQLISSRTTWSSVADMGGVGAVIPTNHPVPWKYRPENSA